MCVCLCTDSAGIAWNELICGYANVVHTSSSFRTHTHTHTHTHTVTHTHIHTVAHTHKPFEDREPTGLKVDIAGISYFVPTLSAVVSGGRWRLPSATLQRLRKRRTKTGAYSASSRAPAAYPASRFCKARMWSVWVSLFDATLVW